MLLHLGLLVHLGTVITLVPSTASPPFPAYKCLHIHLELCGPSGLMTIWSFKLRTTTKWMVVSMPETATIPKFLWYQPGCECKSAPTDTSTCFLCLLWSGVSRTLGEAKSLKTIDQSLQWLLGWLLYMKRIVTSFPCKVNFRNWWFALTSSKMNRNIYLRIAVVYGTDRPCML